MSGSRGSIHALFLLAALAAGACTNNSTLAPKTSSSTKLKSTTNVPTSTLTSFITLARVLRTASAPSSSLDLIGDGSGAFGQYCVGQGETGPTTCSCAYSYIKSDGSSEGFETPTTYHEADLLRCSTVAIPGGLTSFKVKIKLGTTNAFSNEITFQTSAGGTILDLTSPDSFRNVMRYQCRDSVIIPYMLYPAIYDPILSEDPSISNPLNFYTSNFGGTIANYLTAQAMAGLQPGGAGWNCPAVPNDIREGMDLRVWSVANDVPPQGSTTPPSNRIYPPNGTSFDRSTFFLARTSTGVFTVAVNGYTAPNAITQVPSSDGTQTAGSFPPLGYGAAPVPNASGGEDCPTSVGNVPAGYHWVKVWLFRASLPDRKVRGSSRIAALGAVSCNAGSFDGTASGPSVLPECSGASTGTGTIANAQGTVLADRVLGTNIQNGVCVALTRSATTPYCSAGESGAGCTTQAGGIYQKGYATGFSLGSDVWYAKNPSGNLKCSGTTGQNDPMNLCRTATSQYDAVPQDNSPTLSSLDGNVSRFDYLFVVSPPTVMTADFKNGTQASKPYTPFRFQTPGDCVSGNPNAPAFAGDCSPSKVLTYGFKFHDVNTNGDAPANDPGRLPVFPVCAVQPD